MDREEESISSPIVTKMQLSSLSPNLAWKIVHKWNMNWWSKENTIFHVISRKDQKLKRKLTFDIPKFKFQNRLEQKTSIFLAFLRQTGLWEPNQQKNVQVVLQILNPVNHAEILEHEFIGGQSEMVV